jgi:WD40 repeat protein
LRTPNNAHVSSLAFSSTMGNKSILGIGRADGRILLWSPLEQDSRFDSVQPAPICCVAFRPTTVKRPSQRDVYITVDTEELLIGDEVGHVYYYSVEWPSQEQRDLYGWSGALTLLARITAHAQQICGLSWSTDGEWFASGGNDNSCHLYETKKVLEVANQLTLHNQSLTGLFIAGSARQTVDLTSIAFMIPATIAKHAWSLQAAVKAIAFCPWQKGLLAIGGGSNDRCIHFYHTISGASLATIDCHAQVTSLIWSTTRREIAATFGFAQPDHPYRIAVFAWPSCEQIVAVPWHDEHRALYAISYPGGPNVGRMGGEGGMWWSRTQEEGCLVVATSDCSIKFHEIWAEEKRATASKGGMLGGSDILEALHGIDKPGEIIR